MNRTGRWAVHLRAALVVVTLIVSGAVAAEAAFTPPEPPICKNPFTFQQEITEGKKAAQEVSKQMPLLADSSPVTKYIQQLGARLVKYAPGHNWPYNFHVVDAADINAFALPGGPIYVNLGTIQAAETEAQLAGVMAHEISHVALRHATCNMAKQQKQVPFWQLGQVLAGVLLGGTAGNIASAGIGFGAQTLFLRYSRDAEKQADELGTYILYKAGYDPRGMLQFFEIIESKYGSGGAQFLSNHPNPGNRAEYVSQEISQLPRDPNAIVTSAAFKEIKKRVAGMKAYTAKEIQSGAWKKGSPGQAVPSGVNLPSSQWMPQGAWKQLNGSTFQLEYPGNWTAYGSGSSYAVAPEGGIQQTSDGQSSVVYGVLINQFQAQRGASLSDSMNQLVAQLKKGNPRLRMEGSVHSITVNRRPARDAEFSNTPAGRTNESERDWVVAVQQPDGNLRYLVFVAPAENFAKLKPSYERILRSLMVQ